MSRRKRTTNDVDLTTSSDAEDSDRSQRSTGRDKRARVPPAPSRRRPLTDVDSNTNTLPNGARSRRRVDTDIEGEYKVEEREDDAEQPNVRTLTRPAPPALAQNRASFNPSEYIREYGNANVAVAYVWLHRPGTRFEYVHLPNVRQQYIVVDPPRDANSREFTAQLDAADMSELAMRMREMTRIRNDDEARPSHILPVTDSRAVRRFVFDADTKIWHLEGPVRGFIDWTPFLDQWFVHLAADQDLWFYRQYERSGEIQSSPLHEGRIEVVYMDLKRDPVIQVECLNCMGVRSVEFVLQRGEATVQWFGPGWQLYASTRVKDIERDRFYRYVITPYTIFLWYRRHHMLQPEASERSSSTATR